MIGFFKKELRINGKTLLLSCGTLFVLNTLMVIALLSGDRDQNMDQTFFMVFLGFTSVISFIVMGAFSLNLMQTDERRKWCYYVCSVPDGIVKQTVAKYALVAATIGATFLISCGSNLLVRSSFKDVPIQNGMLMLLVCVSLLLRAVELPFVVAFGTKAGSSIKGCLMLVIIMIALLYALFGDLSWLGTEDEFWEKIFRFITDLDIAKLSKSWAGKLIWAAVPLYLVSLFISTRLYLHGVDRMEK